MSLKKSQQCYFDSQKHICKFIFQQVGMLSVNGYHHKITGNLFTNELSIEITDRNDNTLEAYGYKINNHLSVLLPMLIWDDYEKYRDVSSWDLSGHTGYRDGWGYEFICITENGSPMIRNYLDYYFDKDNEPPYERLLRWIKTVYAKKSEFKGKRLLW